MVNVDPFCQWHDCDKPSAKHVIFSKRVFGSVSSKYQIKAGRKRGHCDLCVEHAERILDEYLDVKILELGMCPEHAAEVAHPCVA